MSMTTFTTIRKRDSPPLQATSVCVQTCTGEPLKVLGSINVEVYYEGQRVTAAAYCGWKGSDIDRTGLAAETQAQLAHPLSTFPTLESTLGGHNTLFKDGVGCIKSMWTPFCKPTTMSHALQGRVEQKL